MKVIYEFNLEADKDDHSELEIFQRARSFYLAISDLHDISRTLNKGWDYYAEEQPENDKYRLINVDKLLDDLNDIIYESGYHNID